MPAAQPISKTLLAAARNGDVAAQNEIILVLTPLLVRISSRYFIIGGDTEDLLQEARIGLHNAIRKFDPEKGVDFLPFAKTCIHNNIISAINEANAKKHAALNKSVDIDSAALYSYDSPMDLMIVREHLDKVLARVQTKLSKFEKQVLLLYLDGLSYKKIASQLQTSEKSVSNALCRIRSKLS